ncbi:MAG TPA: condensation domain-containing protein [Candidatus Limnocylindrales bacterium]|nr:condensation domain-containing protein [Candidatus Limnocylindrales bacterium]
MGIKATERVPVAFKGEGAGVGELSWGQQALWNGMRDSGESLTMTAPRQLGPGATIEDFVAELGFYLSQYQAMRTLLRFEPDGHTLQVVHSSGIAEIEVYDAGDRDPAELAAEVETHYATTVFDYQREWPIRWALVRKDGVLTHAVTAISHHVADGASAMAMFEDLRDRDPVTGRPPRPPGIQPLAQAELQQTASARRHNDAAVRYWEEQLRLIPPTMFPAARPEATGERFPGRFWETDYSSPALLLGLRAVATRLQVSTGAVLYAAFASALSLTTGVNPVFSTVTVNNRFRPGLANAGGPMAQLGLCTLDVAGASFDELVLRARRRLLTAQKYAYYAPYENDRLVDRVGRERGVTFDLRCMFNDRRSEDGPIETVAGEAEIRAAIPATTVNWREVDRLHQRLMIHVNEHPEALTALVQVDTAYLGRDDMDALLRRMEATVIAAAA